MNNFWEKLKKVDFANKQNLDIFLQKQLGIPLDQTQSNLLLEIRKKISAYYSENISQENTSVFFLVGVVESLSNIIEKKFKEGKRMGQTFYVLLIGKEKLQALEENLAPEKWAMIKKFAILGQELVFKYKNWCKNKQIIDFYPHENQVTEKLADIDENEVSSQSELNDNDNLRPRLKHGEEKLTE